MRWIVRSFFFCLQEILAGGKVSRVEQYGVSMFVLGRFTWKMTSSIFNDEMETLFSRYCLSFISFSPLVVRIVLHSSRFFFHSISFSFHL